MTKNLKTCLVTIEYRLSDEEQICSCCGGALDKMSNEVHEELKVIPA
ncbi:IS66 family transposase zinc-finger binding domain-containing protein [Virgibacillus oceani]